MLLGVDVGGTFTDAVIASPDGELVHREGADDAGRRVARRVRGDRGDRRARRGAVASVRTRHDRHDQRPARGPGGADRAARDRGLHRHRRARPPGARGPLPAVRRAPARRSCRRSCASRSTSAAARTVRCARRAGWTRSRAASRRSGVEAVAVVLLHSSAHPAHELAVARRAARPPARTCTSRSRTRSAGRRASSSARRPPRSTPRSRRCCAATSPASKLAARPSGCRRPR